MRMLRFTALCGVMLFVSTAGARAQDPQNRVQDPDPTVKPVDAEVHADVPELTQGSKSTPQPNAKSGAKTSKTQTYSKWGIAAPDQSPATQFSLSATSNKASVHSNGSGTESTNKTDGKISFTPGAEKQSSTMFAGPSEEWNGFASPLESKKFTKANDWSSQQEAPVSRVSYLPQPDQNKKSVSGGSGSSSESTKANTRKKTIPSITTPQPAGIQPSGSAFEGARLGLAPSSSPIPQAFPKFSGSTLSKNRSSKSAKKKAEPAKIGDSTDGLTGIGKTKSSKEKKSEFPSLQTDSQ